jgi:cyclopropane fatty-acyl-phospholipid synthase-like methyltransferase
MGNSPPLSIHAWLRYAAIEHLLAECRTQTVLEIGVGQGSVGVRLASRYDYIGIELDDTSFSTARTRFERNGVDPSRLFHGGLEDVNGRRFDLVCAFEVLEHLEDEQSALTEWRAFIEPGGALLVSVPAGPHRFGAADEKAGHFRRYSRAGMEELLQANGFTDIRIVNYGFPAAYALEAARNVLARRELRKAHTQWERTLASGRWLQPPGWMAPLTRWAAAPLVLLQRPFMQRDLGTGLVALATFGGARD